MFQIEINHKKETYFFPSLLSQVPVLRQLAAAHRQGGSVGLPVVILGNREKAEMDAELASSLSARDRRELRVWQLLIVQRRSTLQAS